MDGEKIVVCKKCVFKYVGKNFDQERGYSKLIIEVIICMIMIYVFLFMVSIFYYILCNKLQICIVFDLCLLVNQFKYFWGIECYCIEVWLY